MESPRGVLIETLRDVEEAGVPDDLRVIAFEKLFDLRAGTVRSVEATGAGGGAGAEPAVPPARAQLDVGGDPLARIAQRLGVELETVGEVFDVHDGVVELIIPPGKLPPRPAPATKEIALLVAGGRQAAGAEDWTPIDAIRDVCDRLRRLDSPNFAKTIKEMDDVFNFRHPSPRKIHVRLARPGWEELADRVRRLAGE